MRKNYISDNKVLEKKYERTKFVGDNKIAQQADFVNCKITNCSILAAHHFENLCIKNAIITENPFKTKPFQQNFVKHFDNNFFDDIKIAIGGQSIELVLEAKNLFEELHADIWLLDSGENFLLDTFAKNMLKHKAKIGFWFASNKKEVLAINCKGQILFGDEILYLMSWWLNTQNKLTSRQVLGGVEISLGIENKLKSLGIDLTRLTANQNISEGFAENNFVLAATTSGEVHLDWEKQHFCNPILTSRILASIYLQNQNIWIKAKENKYVQIIKEIELSKNLGDSELSIVKTITDFYALKLKNMGRVLFWVKSKKLYVLVESLEKSTATLLAVELKKKLTKFLR